MEVEKDQQLAFLDVLLKKTPKGLITTIFRKSMATYSVIPFLAVTPPNFKQAAFRFYVDRAFKVCSPEALPVELNTLRLIANNNGFYEGIVDKEIHKINRDK